MMSDPLGTAIRRLLRRVSAAPSAGLSDAELLERFVRSRDEAAIETLLWRHGPMVLTTCRRLLNDHADSEDCFQATFLVLCRRAATITKRQSVGSWLYKVAYRICLRARAGRSRRPVSAAEIGELPAAETVTATEQGELRGLLDKELNQLPERYRAPLILHYLEEKTVAQVAQELGWRPGTVSSRLARGKELLRVRLAGRALTLSAGAAAAALASATATAALPLPLARTTLQALLTGAESQPAASLAQEFLRAQLHNRPKWAVALILAVGTAAGVMGAILTRDRPDDPDRAGASNAGARPAVEGPLRSDADGDPLPQGAILRLGSARFRGGAIMAAYSPDGRVLTTAGVGGIRTWDAVTGRPLQARYHADLRSPYVISEDGKLAATREYGTALIPHPERITIRRLPGLEVLHTLEDPGQFQARHFCFSRDGKRLAADSRFDILVWDVATGKLTSRLPLLDEKLSVEAMALSPDGALLAAVDSRYDQVIRLWDVAGARERQPLKVPLTRYLSLAFSGNGEILMAYGTGSCAYLWDAHTLAAIRRFSIGETAPWPRISYSGKVIATNGAEGALRLWNAGTGQLQAVLEQPAKVSQPARFQAGGHPLAFSPDDRFLVVGGTSPQIKMWNVATGRRVRVTDEPDLAYSNMPGCYAAISPDGNLIATNRGCTIQLWDARTGHKTGGALNVDYLTHDIVFSADGKSLIRERGDILSVADLSSGTHGADARWSSPPGRTYGAGSHPDPILLRQIAAGTAPKIPAGRRTEGGLAALSPDGKTAAWAIHGPPGSISLRDAISGEELHRLPCPGGVATPAFSPDSRNLAVLGKNHVQLWDVASRREVRRFEYAPPEDMLAEWNLHAPLAFSPDGKLVAAASSVDNSIVVWSVATGRQVDTLRGHGGQVYTLAFTPDSRRLLSGSADTTALMWDVSQLIREPDG
jgi:RNA polymerase sigma factor (sigma-70 family)